MYRKIESYATECNIPMCMPKKKIQMHVKVSRFTMYDYFINFVSIIIISQINLKQGEIRSQKKGRKA